MLSWIITQAGHAVPTKKRNGQKIRKFSGNGNLTSRIRFKYLDIIFKFLKNSLVVIIIISLPENVVLMVGISIHIYGFTVDDIQNGVALCQSRPYIRKQHFKLFTDLDMDILKIV